jgi:hypothetical protein
MIKELSNLKVKAIAVEVPEGTLTTTRMVNDRPLLIWVSEFIDVTTLELPPGEWKVIGRANEIEYPASNIPDLLTAALFEADWKEYCAANNLTNELILINKG